MLLELIYSLPFVHFSMNPPKDVLTSPEIEERANTLTECFKLIFPHIFTKDGLNLNINPRDYIPLELFKNLTETEEEAKISNRVIWLDEMGLKAIVGIIQKLYFYNVSNQTLKLNRKLTDEEIKALTKKTREIAENAFEEYIWFNRQVYAEASNDSFPYLSKAPVIIGLTDEILKADKSDKMIEHLIKISPKSRTININIVYTIYLKHIKKFGILPDRDAIFKTQKIVMRDLTEIAGKYWEISPDNFDLAKAYAFDRIESDIKKYEEEFGEIVI